MDVTLGCSLNELKTHAAYRAHAVIDVENPLYPGYLEQDYGADLAYLQDVCRQRLVLDGPYVDLNLGSPEPRVRQLAAQKALDAISFGRACSAESVVFLSTYLPFIGMDFYERGWIAESLGSWREILSSTPGVRIALCNTFEYDPKNLMEIVETLNDPGLELAFDVGHCLIWGRIPVLEWYRLIRDRCRILYLHSNDGQADQHRSIRTGVLADKNVLPALVNELRSDSVVILKYFDRACVETDIQYLQRLIG